MAVSIKEKGSSQKNQRQNRRQEALSQPREQCRKGNHAGRNVRGGGPRKKETDRGDRKRVRKGRNEKKPTCVNGNLQVQKNVKFGTGRCPRGEKTAKKKKRDRADEQPELSVLTTKLKRLNLGAPVMGKKKKNAWKSQTQRQKKGTKPGPPKAAG